MANHTVTLKGFEIVPTMDALSKLTGARPVMLSYKFSKISEELEVLRKAFAERVQPFLNEKGNIKLDLTDDEQNELEGILKEELTVDLPEVHLPELETLSVADDSAIFVLTKTGVVRAEPSN